MTRLIFKIVILVLVLLAISAGVRSFVYDKATPLPVSYSSDQIHLKKTFLMNHTQQFNTLFIGPSHTLYGFNPVLFDSLVSEERIQAFNFGITQLATPELFYLLDSLTANNAFQLRYVFIEILGIKPVDMHNINTTRLTYWHNTENSILTLNCALHSNSSLKGKLTSVFTHSISFADWMLNLGYFNNRNDFIRLDKKIQDSIAVLDNTYNGYGGVETDSVEGKTKKRKVWEEELTARLLSDTSVLEVLRKESADEFEKFDKNPKLLDKYNKVYLSKINEVIALMKSRNIYPVFVMTPRLEADQYQELIPLFNKIPKGHCIEVADGRKYPQLYYMENSQSRAHLNEKGANILTAILAEKFKAIVDGGGAK